MNYKRYGPPEPVCTCGRISCMCENDNIEEVEGEYLKIEDLVVKGCSDDTRDCPFYSEHESRNGPDTHRCGVTGDGGSYYNELDCPFEDVRKIL